LLDCSDAPSVCRWNTVNILCLMPDSFMSTFQKQEMKSLSWSVISSLGQPFSQNHLLKKMVANSSTVMLDLQGAICTSAPNLSIIMTMALKLSSFRSGPMKSIIMESKHLSGIGSGCRGLAGLDVWPLLH